MINLASIVIATENQVSSDLGDEMVILGLKSGVYYGLDPVGARIWSLLQEEKTVAQIKTVLLQEYEVEPERCESDLLELLDQLAAENLITVKDVTPA